MEWKNIIIIIAITSSEFSQAFSAIDAIQVFVLAMHLEAKNKARNYK
jgi:hypothetical protein